MRVLIADDDPVGRQMMATAIELLGHEVTQVADGQDAVDGYVAARFEIVVLDWMMPNLDGIAVARRIRALQAGGTVPTDDLLRGAVGPVQADPVILLATAFDEAHVVAAALEAGVDDYMVKPLSMAEIRARIAVAVERFHLRRRVEERERTLRRERAQAEALSRGRAQFLANMSHELRTPLNGMVGMSDFLLSGDLPPQVVEAAEIIRASALSLSVIIDDILDLTQVDEGKVSIEPKPFDVRVIMDQIVGLYAVRANKAGLELETRIAEGVPEVLVGDPIRIRQILSNLLNNALKFTKRGRISVDLRLQDGGSAGTPTSTPVYRFSVTDTGPGISAQRQEGLFQRFFRGEVEEAGHGLGLAISRGLVELMGGTIGLDSAEGQGSTFWFDLPLEAARAVADVDARGVVRQPRAPIHALVVEDDRFNQTVARRLLERAGCTVSIADDGRRGLEQVEQRRPDIVFMDVQMPVMNGLDAAREIRRRESEGQQLPIVGLTASSVAGARRRCLEAGMNGYLQKPVQLSAIIDALVRFLPDRYDGG